MVKVVSRVVAACPACDKELLTEAAKFCSYCGQPTVAIVADDEFDGLINQVVDGRYKVLGRIGTGGMGVVYRVQHVRMGKVAAMKVLRRDLAGDADATRRFQREAAAVSRLEHPHIVQTFDFGEWKGLLYLVMEYLKGHDLGALCKRDGPLEPVRALRMFAQVASALDEAHAAGIIHRDLKPDNIVCISRRREDEHVKVLDFGLAKLRAQRPGVGDITGVGSLIGTPYYMAPEQVRGEEVDERTDIYALGATLYRVLTGEPVFAAETPMAILGKHVNDAVVPPSQRRAGLGPEVDALVLRCLAKERSERFPSASAMREAIEAVLHDLATMGRASTQSALPAWVDNPVTAASLSAAPDPGKESSRDPILDPSENRLRREDVDVFESRLRARHRALGMAAIVILAAALVGGTVLYRRFGPVAGPAETEPNDTPATANLLPQGRPVYGTFGVPAPDRDDPGQPDADTFRIPASKNSRVVIAKISGIPDLDVVLSLYDNEGRLVVKADGGKEGEGEVLGPIRIHGSESYIRAQPVWVGGQAAAAADAPYALTVSWGPAQPGWELEPNDDPAQANRADTGGSFAGFLSSAEDRDWYVVSGAPGTKYTVSVAPPDDLKVVLLDASAATPIDRAAGDATLRASVVIPAEGKLMVGVAVSPQQPADARPDRLEPYTLTIDRED